MDDRSLPPADIAAVKPVALEEFASMNDCEPHLLLELRWPAMRDASLTPVLRAMLDQSPTDNDAIERLIELDPEGMGGLSFSRSSGGYSHAGNFGGGSFGMARSGNAGFGESPIVGAARENFTAAEWSAAIADPRYLIPWAVGT